MLPQIPFNKPFFSGNESNYISDAIRRGHISGDGTYTKRCRKILESDLDAKSVLLTTSCTHALEMTALLLNIKPGDEIIVPSFTFVSTINAFVLRGAKPIFVDIRKDTKNINESLIEGLITERTKAIVPVHYAGVACEMDIICAVAKDHGISVIEDNAHGLFGKYKNRSLGSFGEMSTLSFHETKNIQCGEGGALIINEQNFCDRAEIIREKGTNRARFFRGEVDKYSWVDVGSSYLPSDLLAAYLLAQLESKDKIQKRRQQLWQYYFNELSDWAKTSGVQLPFVPEHVTQAYHMFYIVLPDMVSRELVINHLKAHNIYSVFHYLPLNTSEMGSKLGCRQGDCPVTEDISDRILRLPFFVSLSDEEQERVVKTILQIELKGPKIESNAQMSSNRNIC